MVLAKFVFVLLPSGLAFGQVLNQDQEIRVPGLPSLLARSDDPSDILLTSLDTILHDRSICYGWDSALGDSAQAASPESLKDVAATLAGRHLLSDGRPIQVTAEFWPTDAVNSGTLIGALTERHALLMSWDSHLYVVYGVIYRWIWSGGEEGGGPVTVVRKFLLLDTSRSGAGRKREFSRDSDDLAKVQGLMFVKFKLQ